MKNRKTINIVAAATTMAAWYGLFLFFHPCPPPMDCRPHEATGEVLAGEAVKLLEPGARLIVIARDPGPFQVPASIAQLNAFLHALKRSGTQVAASRTFQVDPLRPVGVPAGEFFDLIRNGRDNDVIVSFLGPPVFSRDQLKKLGNKRPRILAVCSGGMQAQVDLRSIFEQKLLVVAIVSREDAPARARPGSKRSAFEQMFRLITPDNLFDLQETVVVRN
jgi:hypothetical protein